MTAKQYDPVPGLAALIDGLQRMAATGNARDAGLTLGNLLTGPYARLRGGLLLDEPGWEDMNTADAIREALHYLDLSLDRKLSR